MTNLPPSLRPSAGFVRSLMLSYLFGSSLLLSSLFAGFDLVERHREVIFDAEHARDVIAATLSSPMSDRARQAVIMSYANSSREDQLDGMNVLLVVNNYGKVVLTSRASWLGLQITDPLLRRSETSDPDFDSVVQCFRRAPGHCLDLSSSDLKLRTGSFTVVRPVQGPQVEIGLPRQRFLVVANYDPGVVLADYMQDLVIILLFSLVISGLLSLGLWLALAFRLLPRLAEVSHTDELTRLSNRSLFMDRAKELLAAAEYHEQAMVFAILDLDHFKQLNDSYGHRCGDAALAHVGEIFRLVTRPDDLVCRFGGEEFALLITSSRDGAGRVLERLRLQLEMTRLTFAGHQLKLSVSIGAAATAECGYNVDYLYSRADKALYAAKQAGRNRLHWSDARSVSRLSR